jgi:ferritin
MKLSDTLVQAFDQQITLELTASTVYRQLSIEMDVRGLPGMASWLRHQAEEEVTHAHRFVDHLVDRGNHPHIGGITTPEVQVGSALGCFRAALAHEQKVSESIRELCRAADREGDLDSRPLLDWFLTEQIEEEATVGALLGQLELIGDDGAGLLRLDAELGRRASGSESDGP